MSYKIDSEKGFKLLRCISPPIIFVNGFVEIETNKFVEKFKKEGFNVLNINEIIPAKDKNNQDKYVEYIQKYLKTRKEKSFDTAPLIINASISNDKLISDIFNGDFHNFTYVYIYPNNSKKYKENISSYFVENKADQLMAPFLEKDESNKNADLIKKIVETDKTKPEYDKLMIKLTVEMIKINKAVYTQHLETFDDKILTILI